MKEGFRESTESWSNCLLDLKKGGLNEPALAMADGGLGFWAALPKVWRQTKSQLCWLHKMRAYLGQSAKLPLAHSEAILRLRGIYSASSREVAEKLAKELMNDWKQAGYYQAIECLFVALPRLLTFYDFPAEHHRHLRTTNVIESPFASVRLRARCGEKISVSAKRKAFSVQNTGKLRAAVANNQSSRKVERSKNATNGGLKI